MDTRSKLIVLPLQPNTDQEYNGIGLGIHFLLGNMIAVHSGLAEFWFGWRANKIFKSVSELHEFCRNKNHFNTVGFHAKEQKIRYWLYGKYKHIKDILLVSLTLYDDDFEKKYDIDLYLEPSDFFVGFGQALFNWLGQCGLPLDHQQISKALWKEDISIKGLECLGWAVETTYRNYIDPLLFKDGLFDLEWFEKAVIESPMSFLTNDLKGWAFYKNKDYKKAKDSFKKALALNPAGIGALSGMMWCHFFEKNKEKAMAFAIAKADVTHEPHDAAVKFIEKKFQN
ncbi:MAG: tetratricopeptide repeat protein [Proteobacteria bacterium]|nr:tetratricopeptide repeat protein [Pseudomonadota bacterium]MBU1585002.1 tetratricopeptide repeat protein [Pseudomonadota bacterium]MBU2453936.1 tetratricopeptide repeat protein [Pseudomonadota bacterium]MBU2630315.1 tetratricopeptide repeat protein [Pseudomonadota bacterium]